MMADRGRVDELMAEASDLPPGTLKVTLLEEAVQVADTLNDVELAYQARNKLIDAGIFSGRPDVALVAFSWCLAQFDRTPDRFDSWRILWQYKWIVANSLSFPEISRDRLERLLDDMERRHREWGSTLHVVAMMRRDILEHFGDLPGARAAHAQYRRRRRDSLSDCAACCAGSDCGYFAGQKKWSLAVRAAEPVLQGRLTCSEEPHRILASVLRPLFQLGRLDEAKAYQKQGYRLVGNGNQFVTPQAKHLEFAVLVGDMPLAKRLVERHLPNALGAVSHRNRFTFLIASRFWAARLAATDSTKVKLRFPAGVIPFDDGARSDVVALGDWFTTQVEDIARRFDSRNGNREFRKSIDQLPELLRLAASGGSR